MNAFPSYLQINNRKNFEHLNYDRIISLLRQDIHTLLLHRNNENDYFDLELFFKKHEYYNRTNCEKIVLEVTNEIRDLGWHVKLSFAETGLFIYSDKVPSSCW